MGCFKSWKHVYQDQPLSSCVLLTDTRSESVGPSTRFRWIATCSLGDVCYVHWAHVHTHLHCQTSQVCHIVSCLRPFHSFLQPVRVCFPLAFFSVMELWQADVQWHLPLRSFGTALRTHALPRCDSQPFHSSTVEVHVQDGVDLPFDMSRLTTGRSALGHLQRSCGTKVRRVAACRRTLP